MDLGSALELGATTINSNLAASGDTWQGGQVARSARLGVLGEQPTSDVPFSVTSYTAKTIADQQARTLGDVLLNDAAVRQSAGFGNFSQVFTIRGLPLSTDDISYNGLYGVLPRQIITTEALERVEVFKGPNAFLNGVAPRAAVLAVRSTWFPSVPQTRQPATSASIMPPAPMSAATWTWANGLVKTTASAPVSTWPSMTAERVCTTKRSTPPW